MPSVITLTGPMGGHANDEGDSCKWSKRNKRTGCQIRVCRTGRGKSGWSIVANVCGAKQKARRAR